MKLDMLIREGVLRQAKSGRRNAMPIAIYSLFWDDTLGPFVGRSFPEEEPLAAEEAVVIFMGHGVNLDATSKLGYTKLKRGLIISYLASPNCIAVLLDEEDDRSIVERNLLRLVTEIDFTSEDWDEEIRKAFHRLNQLIAESSGSELLSDLRVKRFVDDLKAGRIRDIKPLPILRGMDRFPVAANYFGTDEEEVARILRDLENEGFLTAVTYGRRVQCTFCGSVEVGITLVCPSCNSSDLHNVYTVFCPNCKAQFHAVIADDLKEVTCHSCKSNVEIADLTVTSVEVLCNACGTATDDPKITLTCRDCSHHFKPIDLLAGTGLAYYPR